LPFSSRKGRGAHHHSTCTFSTDLFGSVRKFGHVFICLSFYLKDSVVLDDCVLDIELFLARVPFFNTGLFGTTVLSAMF